MIRCSGSTAARMRQMALMAMTLDCSALRAKAQEPTPAVRDGWIVGGLVGVPGWETNVIPELFTIGVGATRLQPNRLGVDLALGTMPRAVAEGVVVLGARVGGAVPLALGRDAFLIPSVGLSGIGGVGGGGVGGAGGVYAGLATVVATGSLGFRAGVTGHRFNGFRGTVWLVELGLMHVPLPRAP
jgi:hypothetical protein